MVTSWYLYLVGGILTPLWSHVYIYIYIYVYVHMYVCIHQPDDTNGDLMIFIFDENMYV